MHRASSLLAILPNALETGFSEIDPEPVPLKVRIKSKRRLSTKMFRTSMWTLVIEAEDTEARFILAGPETPCSDHERRTRDSCESWDQAIKGNTVDDSTWHSDLAQYLTHLVDLRVAHVENWLESNVQRFEGVTRVSKSLRRTFDNAVIDLRASVELCRSQCGSCSLICVRSSRLHRDGHDCLTNHKCIHDCTFCERDALPHGPVVKRTLFEHFSIDLAVTYHVPVLAIQEIICEFRTFILRGAF
jgi:hypothetical protein